MDDQPTGLDDPDYAAFAWARYRRMLGWMALAAVIAVSIAIYILDQVYGPLSWIAILAAIGGFGGTIMMAAALMGLAFLSSGTGHDEDVDRREP
ncbi:MAG: hypothetical protein JWO16_965 [Sphingomonas bacterium]|nr:hypothetical protein [Sphingomonas bacterium]